MEQQDATAGQELNWLLDDLAAGVDQIKHAVILSRDGLTVAASKDLSREDAEHLSALSARRAEPRPGRGRALQAR